MKRILVTGGAGFIGSAIITELRKSAHDIYVIDNLSFGNRDFIDQVPDDHFFNVDILNRQELITCIQKVDPEWVIHLAAVHFIPFCNEHPFLSANINIQGTINLLDSCQKLKNLQKVFFASTAAVYPIVDHAMSESLQPSASDIYGLSKITGEKILSEFNLKTGIAVIVCRFFNAFGPNETNPHLIPVIQEQINKGIRTLKLGNLEPKRDYIHTHDMAEAVNLLLEKFSSGYDVFNLGSGREYSVKDIVEVFEKQLGEKLNIEQDPSRMRKSDRMHLLADINKLSSYISWKPRINIYEGIHTLIENKVPA
jgi:UDP-glucose 4-epimerase